MAKVYLDSYVEAWIGFKLSTDNELMYTSIGAGIDPGGPFDTPNVASTNTLCDAVITALRPLFSPVWTLGFAFALWGNEVAVAANPEAPSKIMSTSVPVLGTRASTNALPQNCAVIIRKNRVGRRGGRMYLPGVDEALVQPNGSIDAAQVTTYQTAATALFNAITGIPGIGGPQFIGKLVPSNAHSQPVGIDSLTVDPVIGTQRRRLR